MMALSSLSVGFVASAEEAELKPVPTIGETIDIVDGENLIGTATHCDRIGVSKAYSVVDFALLESCVRDYLNVEDDCAMAVLRPEKEVRLKGAYFVKFASAETDENSNVTAVRATYDPESKGGESPDGRKVKGAKRRALF